MEYIAHKREDGTIQPLIEHLRETAKLAGEFAGVFGAERWGYTGGYLHDIGKYSIEFYNRIMNNGPKIDHSTAGAQECEHPLLKYCIAGHHGGLPDGGTESDTADKPTLNGRLKRTTIPNYSDYKKEIEIDQFRIPNIVPEGFQDTEKPYYYDVAFFTRMVFSCIVDADFLDTEEFMQDGRVKRGGYDSLDALYTKYKRHVKEKFEHPQGVLGEERNKIYEECIKAGRNKKGIFTLTVPTGGGKTISSLGFAFEHTAQHQELRRIIYVIPYTSIIEQTAKIFREILGTENVIEDHSLAYSHWKDDEGNTDPTAIRHRISAENWDAPIVVTTNVQFFESLYSNKTSKCRKLHNIANSILIFDEVQMLPVDYLQACVRGIYELTHNYGCTAVLCSATQIQLKDIFTGKSAISEICPRQKEMQEFFKRVSVQNDRKLNDDDLIKRIEAEKSVLCILNSRKHARKIAQAFAGCNNVYHLSTYMVPLHRLHIIHEIKALPAGAPRKVISTSLMEAGVDLDFSTVYREYTGIDSIVQAAGRCNREGKASREDSILHVFESEEYTLPSSLKLPISIAEPIIAQFGSDIITNEAIEQYFSGLYRARGQKGLDLKGIIELCNTFPFPFATISETFKLIEENTKTVIVPFYFDGNAQIEKSYQLFCNGAYSREVMRDIGKISVSVYEEHYVSLQLAGVLQEIDDGTAILKDKEYYDPDVGLLHGYDPGDGIFIERKGGK